MNVKVFSIFDKKSRSYRPPFFSHNEETAIRTLRKIAECDQLIQDFPSDFDLYVIGKWDDVQGKIEGFDPDFLMEVGSMVEKEKYTADLASAGPAVLEER